MTTASPGNGRGSIVVAGEALVDLVPGEGDALRAHLGGGPFTVARAAARLGAPTSFLGRLSTDRFGARLRAALAADGVALDTAVATDDPTTLAVAEVGADGTAAYHFYADGTSAPGLTEEDVARALRAGTSAPGLTEAGVAGGPPTQMAMLCVGTLGLVFEPSAATLEHAVAAAGDDVLVAVDPNVRPAAIADPDRFRARLLRILACADLVKASVDDLAWLHPGLDPVAAMRTLLAGGRGLGIITLGATGALVVAGEAEPISVAAPQVEVVDTIGAGDAFLGALLAFAHATGLDRTTFADPAHTTKATTYACRAAALTCTHAGAQPARLSEM